MNLIKKTPISGLRYFLKKKKPSDVDEFSPNLTKKAGRRLKKKERKHEGELDKFSASGKVAPSFTLPQSSSPRESQHDKSICLESSSGY
jgi:hypothetical protein